MGLDPVELVAGGDDVEVADLAVLDLVVAVGREAVAGAVLDQVVEALGLREAVVVRRRLAGVDRRELLRVDQGRAVGVLRGEEGWGSVVVVSDVEWWLWRWWQGAALTVIFHVVESLPESTSASYFMLTTTARSPALHAR